MARSKQVADTFAAASAPKNRGSRVTDDAGTPARSGVVSTAAKATQNVTGVPVDTLRQAGNLSQTAKTIRQLRSEGLGGMAKKAAKSGWQAIPFWWKLAVVAGALLLVACLLAVVLVAMAGAAAVMGPSSSVGVVANYTDDEAANSPNGDDGGGASLWDRDELNEVRDELEGDEPELLQCLGSAPAVEDAADGPWVATQEEADAQHDAERERRQRVEETWKKPENREQARKLKDAQKKERDYRKEYSRQRKLTDTSDRLATPGGQVMDSGQVDAHLSNVARSVPDGVSMPTAKAFITVGLAGAETSWEHFEAVAKDRIPGGLSGITDDNLGAVYRLYAGDDFDAAPYEKAASSQAAVLAMSGRVDDDPQEALEAFDDCFNQGR